MNRGIFKIIYFHQKLHLGKFFSVLTQIIPVENILDPIKII